MTRLFLAAAALTLTAVGAGRAGAGAVYTFDNLPQGTAVPFSDTQGGITARFSDEAGHPNFFVGDASGLFFPPFSGNALANRFPNGGDAFAELVITFSTPIHSVSVDVGTNFHPENESGFTLRAYSGGPDGTFLGQTFRHGSIPPGSPFVEQTTLTFGRATPFDTIIVAAGPQPDLWVDNVALNMAPIPEPTGLTLVGTCLAGLAVRAWRTARSRTTDLRTPEAATSR